MLWIYIIKKKLKNKPLCSVLRSDAKPSGTQPGWVPEAAGQENYLIT